MLHFMVNFANGRKFISSKAINFATQDHLRELTLPNV
jgi:hypothetical protein